MLNQTLDVPIMHFIPKVVLQRKIKIWRTFLFVENWKGIRFNVRVLTKVFVHLLPIRDEIFFHMKEFYVTLNFCVSAISVALKKRIASHFQSKSFFFRIVAIFHRLGKYSIIYLYIYTDSTFKENCCLGTTKDFQQIF